MVLKTLVNVCAACALAVVVGGIYMQANNAQFSRKSFPGGLRSAGLAMELVRVTDDVQNIVPRPADRACLWLVSNEWILFSSRATGPCTHR